jgi:Domain of unknown function (DUF6431)
MWERRVSMTITLSPFESAENPDVSALAPCRHCGGRLRKWGHGRTRVIRAVGAQTRLRPRRVRCAGCGVTHVILPADVLIRRRDSVDVIGQAWRSLAGGLGARRIAHQGFVPMETARGWLRRLRSRARCLYGPLDGPDRSAVRLALLDEVHAASAAGWRGDERALWRHVAHRHQGALLSNTS